MTDARAVMPSQCLVSLADYLLHWDGRHGRAPFYTLPLPGTVIYVGANRRHGVRDRRSVCVDRRCEGARGRRYRLADRRVT